MNPDPEPHAELLAKMRATHAEFSARAEELRAQGMEVERFLRDCEEFIAALEGRWEGEFDVVAYMARLTAFVEEAKEYAHLQEQAKAVGIVAAFPGMMEWLEEHSAKLRTHGGRMEQDSAEQLAAAVARMREELAAGKLSAEALGDAMLTLESQQAELNRRMKLRTAACFLYWEKWPPERWARLSPEEKLEMEGILAKWKVGREEVLGVLPLEDRRRLEAMSYEDFDKPGAHDV